MKEPEMDRQTALERLRRNQVTKALQALMEAIKPGEQLKWGSKKYEELVGYAACELAVEYEAVTGLPIVEMLDAAGATTVTDVELPKKTVEEPPPVTTTEPVVATPSDDALPL